MNWPIFFWTMGAYWVGVVSCLFIVGLGTAAKRGDAFLDECRRHGIIDEDYEGWR